MTKNKYELYKYLSQAIKILGSIKGDEKNNDNKWKTIQPSNKLPLIITNRFQSSPY